MKIFYLMIVQVNVVIEEFDMNMILNKIKIDSLRKSPLSFSGFKRNGLAKIYENLREDRSR
jgi:hypothetical protein